MAFHIDNSSRVFIINTVFVAYLMVAGSMLLFVCFQLASGCEDDKSRYPRSNTPKFIEGPKGDPCVLNVRGGGDTSYVNYANETYLICDLCPIGEVLVSNCTSTTYTKCRLLTPDEGQIMPHPNFCTSGFPCKTCPGPSLTVKKLCDYEAMDTECECAVGYYPVNFEADKCLPLPRCNEGFEPRRPGDGTEVGAEMICQNCRDGFYQPNDNSTDLCTMYTNCIETPGTDVSDNVCKGDPQSSGLPATSPNENAASVFLTTPSTQVSIGPTSPTLEGTTDSLNQTGGHLPDNVTDQIVVKDNKVTLDVFSICTICTLSGGFMGCVLCLVSLILCDSYKKYKQHKAAPTEEQHELEGITTETTAMNVPSSVDDAAEEPCVTTDLTSKKGRRDLQKKIKQRGGKRR